MQCIACFHHSVSSRINKIHRENPQVTIDIILVETESGNFLCYEWTPLFQFFQFACACVLFQCEMKAIV